MKKNNVVTLDGGPVRQADPEINNCRAWAQLHEEVATLQDLATRMAQQLQDELDDCSAKGEFRPDLQALLEEGYRVLSVGGEE